MTAPFGRMFQGLADEAAHDPTDAEHDVELPHIAEAMRNDVGEPPT